jgi:catalase
MPKKSSPKAARPGTAEDRRSVHYNDQSVTMGGGGETHQIADGTRPVLTTQQGIPISDDQNSLKIGARGPTSLEDFHFREKLFHFDHERIPERVVHARGFGAHGYFENYESLSDITKADLFQRAGEKTPLFVRFSTVALHLSLPRKRVPNCASAQKLLPTTTAKLDSST